MFSKVLGPILWLDITTFFSWFCSEHAAEKKIDEVIPFFLESDLQPCLILFQPLGYGKILILPTGFEHGGEHSIFSSIFRQTTAHVFPMYFQCISTNKNPQYIHGYNRMSIPFSEPSSFELHRVEVAQEVVRALKKEVLSNV